ncbi:MFS general substrate transporter [Thozetella sp. PMI_491]|nr:MFS general substrate transporter [Thozetella sp. PMI_491]
MIVAYRYAKRKYEDRRQQRTANGTTGNAQDGPTSGSEVVTTAAPPAVKSKEKKEHTPEEIAEKKRRRTYRYKIVFGLMLPFTLQALDTTIIASAMPFIAQDFNEIGQLNWIISSFNLTSAAFLPVWAQITDVFGRHATIQSAMLVMAVGSAICTGAPTDAFGVLLFGRALQGIGCAGSNISVHTVLADKVSLADYSINWTIFALCAGISFSIGPVIGGYLTQASWRWCFAINLPVAAVGIVVVAVLLRKEMLGPQPLPELEGVDTSRRRGRLALRLATFDYGGQLLFLWGMGLMVLAFTWAGGTHGWGTPYVLAPLIIGSVLAVSWLVYEYLMMPGKFMARVFPLQRAMMPWTLITNRDVGLLFFVNFGIGMAMYAVMYFMDLYFVLVQGNSPSKAGIALLYYLPGMGVGGYMSMFASNVWPRQTLPSVMLGNITSAVGITVLAWATHQGNLPVIYGMMALTGHGVGIRLNASSIHALAYFPTATAQITCLLAFAMPLGGAIALTMMSTVFNNKSGDKNENARDGIMWAFVALVPFMWLFFVASTFLGNVWIRKDGGHEVVHGSYIWSLVFGKKQERVRMARGLNAPAAPATVQNGEERWEPATEMKTAAERRREEDV